MTRESVHTTMMAMAHRLARRGTCSRAEVGALLARDGRIISTGYNGAPSGMEHCKHLAGHAEYCKSHTYVFEGAKPVTPLRSLCGPCTCEYTLSCKVSVHAEVNAVAFAARNGVATEGASLYCTHEPCTACAKILINAGVTAVYFGQNYGNTEAARLLEASNMMMLYWPLPDEEYYE